MIITKSIWIRLLVVVTYLAMIIVNILANAIPINNQTTGQVSNAYPNLFAPAGYTFSIWVLIYLLLAVYTLYQLGLLQREKTNMQSTLFDDIGLYFLVSNLANIVWIFAWHYHIIALSVWMIVIILICLILIYQRIKKAKLTKRQSVFIKLPFSIYFGWITVATIANVTTYLVSLGWDGFGIKESVWTIVVIILGLVITLTTIIKSKDITYGLVIIWAYFGILYKHQSELNGQYPSIIITLIISLVVLILVEVYLFFFNRRRSF